jgi:hypothetical protein
LNTAISLKVPDDKVAYIHVSKIGMFIAAVKPDKPKEGTGEHSMG